MAQLLDWYHIIYQKRDRSALFYHFLFRLFEQIEIGILHSSLEICS